jgi:hypothetical protein
LETMPAIDVKTELAVVQTFGKARGRIAHDATRPRAG